LTNARLLAPNGDLIASFDLPENLSEVPLNRYIDFITEMAKAEPDDIVLASARAVSFFFGLDIMEVIHAAFDMNDNDTKESSVNTVAHLYGYAASLIDQELQIIYANPPVNILSPFFVFSGETYNIPDIVPKVLASSEDILPNLSVIEVIEAAEIRRVCQQLTDENGDLDGSLVFTKYLSMLAVIARKDGEFLPIDEVDRRQFIANRVRCFGGDSGIMIDTKTALSVDFFLTAFSLQYANGHSAPTFLFLQSLATVKAVHPISPSHLPKPKAKRKTTRLKSLKELDGAPLLRSLSKKDTSKHRKKQT